MDPKEVARRLERIRNTVQEQLAVDEGAGLSPDLLPEKPPLLRPGIGLTLSGEPNLSSTPELEEANAVARVSALAVPPSRVPVFGPLLTFVRRLTNPLVKVFMGHHLAHQEAFNAHIVRHLNDVGARLEDRMRELEEALIVWSANQGGLDARMQAALDDYDSALRQRHMVLFSTLGDELTTLQNLARDSASRHAADLVELSVKVDRRFDEKDEALEALHQQINQKIADALNRLESTAAEFLNIRAVLRQVREEAGQQLAAGPTARDGGKDDLVAGDPAWEGLDAWLGDQDYRAFQASFRGDPEEIAERMRAHLALFEGVKGPIADLGCGRGEFLDLLAEAGHRAIGVETNAADVKECLERGHEAVVADLFDWLEQQAPGSLGGVFLAQVIEHLAPPQWQRLVDLAATRLRPGGCLVVETINPESIYAMLRAYVADPTHVRPVHPGLLEFLARRAGFRVAFVGVGAIASGIARIPGAPRRISSSPSGAASSSAQGRAPRRPSGRCLCRRSFFAAPCRRRAGGSESR